MDKTTKNKMDKKKCNNSPTKIQHRKPIKKPKNQSCIMTILDNARSIHEIGWGKLIEMIKYKAQWYGREFVQIDQWFPSSKKCSFCGEINHGLGREERVWQCPHCHFVHQRDVNAAINILFEGLRAVGSPVPSLVDFMHIITIEFKEPHNYKIVPVPVCMA